jgi:ABC-type transport system substrate-binding protein
MMVGTNQDEFIEASGMREFIKEIPVNFHPAYTGNPDVYVPLEELPEESRMLWDYNPELAKKMLAEAGYPNGFKATVNVEATATNQEKAALLKAQWERIGVDLTIKSVDNATFSEMWYGRNYKGVFYVDYQYADLATALHRYFRTDGILAASVYSNPVVDDLIDKAFEQIDPLENARYAKQAAQIVLDDCPFIPVTPYTDAWMYWKWVHNTTGCFQNEDWGSPGPVLARLWMDLNLKKQMGY